MGAYDRVNTNEENGITHDDDQQMLSVATPSSPLWQNATTATPVIVSSSKFGGDITPTSPGAYYATIQSTASSRRYKPKQKKMQEKIIILFSSRAYTILIMNIYTFFAWNFCGMVIIGKWKSSHSRFNETMTNFNHFHFKQFERVSN